MGSYFPESQRGTTESGWFLGHASPKVFSWAFLRTPERRAAATTGINDPGYKAGASKEGPTVSRRALLLGLSFILPSLRPRLRWIRECVGIKRDWHNRSVAVVRVAVLRTLLDQTDLRRRRGPVACQI